MDIVDWRPRLPSSLGISCNEVDGDNWAVAVMRQCKLVKVLDALLSLRERYPLRVNNLVASICAILKDGVCYHKSAISMSMLWGRIHHSFWYQCCAAAPKGLKA